MAARLLHRSEGRAWIRLEQNTACVCRLQGVSGLEASYDSAEVGLPMCQVAPAAAKRSLPDMEVCLSPALPQPDGLPSFGSTLPNKGLQKARRPKKPPTPRGTPALRASFSGACLLQSPQRHASDHVEVTARSSGSGFRVFLHPSQVQSCLEHKRGLFQVSRNLSAVL